MDKSNFYYLGKITRKYSFKGELIIFLDTDSTSFYKNLEKVYLGIDNSFIPYFIDSLSIYKSKNLKVKFEEIKNEDEAKQLINKKVYLPINSLPKLDGKKFYYHEVIGFEVQDINFGKIGVIESVNEQSPQHLFLVKSKNDKIYIPINDDLINKIDRPKKTIKMNLPDGLINLNS